MGLPDIYDSTTARLKMNELRNKMNPNIMSSLDDTQSRHHIPYTLLCPIVATD